ncbi:hypothetical protein [Cryobacterium sp. SO1]|uniref:hypothetical protein n=1 Tax=Cryobacterium sp. SO1 TaxID=1897061 RepID=UPI00102399D5|nr:hypothetical protein [Cryobacterium sp. SO1]
MDAERPKMTTINGKFRPPTDGTALPTLTFALSDEAARATAPSEALGDFMRAWAPPGTDTWYVLKIDQAQDSGRQSIEASLVVPSVNAWQLGEARLSRIGGRSPEDVNFRHQLYMRIGAAAVAGGRIEAAMKRLLLHMSGSLEPTFADSDDPWKTLDRKLRNAATALGERAADVVKVLDWGQANNIRDIRNDIIHAYWWDYSDVGITRGRVYQDGTSELIQITPEQLDEDCQKLHDYAETLDSAMDGLWLNIYLPRLNEEAAETLEQGGK